MTDESTPSGAAGPDRLGQAAPLGPDRLGRPEDARGGPFGDTPEEAPGGAPAGGGAGSAARGGATGGAYGVGTTGATGGPGGFPSGPGTPGGGTDPGQGRFPLKRSRKHKVVAGVCGGLGRYFDIDPVIFRVVFAVLALTGGVGLLLYGVAWLFTPAQGESRNEAQRLLSGRVDGSGMAAVLTALAGCGVFLSTLGSDGGPPFPLFVIGAALAAVYWSQRRRGSAAPSWTARGGTTPVADAPPAAQPPPTPATPSWWKDAGTAAGAEPAPGTRPYLWGPDDGTEPDGPHPRDRDGCPDKPERPREDRSFLGFATFCLAVLAGGIGVSASWPSPLGTSLQIGSACALAVLGGGLVLGSVFGRAKGGTIFLAAVTTALLIGSAAIPKTVEHNWQERYWKPTAVADVRPSYKLGTGHADLDLTALDPKGSTVRVRVEVGAGLVQVRVPENVRVDVRARAGVGVLRVPGYGRDDIDVSADARRKTVLEPVGPVKQRLKGVFKVDVEAGVGQVEVIREAP